MYIYYSKPIFLFNPKSRDPSPGDCKVALPVIQFSKDLGTQGGTTNDQLRT